MARFTIVILAAFVELVFAYNTGAPNSACMDMTPNHVSTTKIQPMAKSTCPYTVQHFYDPRRRAYNLTIMSPRREMFKGFLLTMADERGMNLRPNMAGTFSGHGSFKRRCGGVTHSNAVPKYSPTFIWTPPNGPSNSYRVKLTIVKSFEQFWVNCGDILISPNTNSFGNHRHNSLNLPREHLNRHDTSHGQSIFNTHSSHRHPHGFGTGHHSHSLNRNHGSLHGWGMDSSMIGSSQNPNSQGNDESGDSIENSVDVSDNRSGSSLRNDEKEAMRQRFFAEGMPNFNKDINKLLRTVGKSNLIGNFNSAPALSASVAPLLSLACLIARLINL